ncbi:MAG: Flp family type IVb pilin [Gaiella sp.]
MITDSIRNTTARVHNAVFNARDKEEGQTLVEYALIIALVSLAAIAALGFLSGRIQRVFSKAGNSLNAVCVSTPTGPCP